MSWKEYIDADEVRKAVEILQEPGGVFEIRAIGTTKKDIISGYFRDADTLLQAFNTIDVRDRNIYITLSEIKEELFARAQSERFLKSQQATSDTEVINYRWLFVDLDPVRTAGISSSEAELESAKLMAREVCQYMHGLGFADPVKALSGNGYHILYRIDIENDAEGRSLIERCLKALSERFDTNEVKIDTTNSNPSRICKLYGTLAQKGRSTKNRPHRMSKIFFAPEPVEITRRDILQKLAGEVQAEQERLQTAAHQQAQEFDLLDFMHRHGMTYTEDANDRARIYKLDECPFDSSHRNGDAKIFQYQDGAIAFKCHHNSCNRYRWQDVRLKYEPDAYDDNTADDERIDAGYRLHKQQQQEQEQPKPKQKKKFRKLKTAKELMAKDLPEPEVFVGVGEEVPLLVEGTCILSAKPKLGKSWFALSMCLAISNGEDFLGYRTKRCSTLYLDLETDEPLQQKRLKKALAGREVPDNFYLDTETDNIEDGFTEQIQAYLKEDPNIGVVVIDVFQIIRSRVKSVKESEYEHAYRDITPLNELAHKYHISIILVCHDRKAVNPDDPFDNILGSTGLQGAATQMVVMFRSKKEDPIHISIKGKTIDGLPELNVSLENAKWSTVEGLSRADREKARDDREYQESKIRAAVLKIAEDNSLWTGSCSQLKQDAIVLYDVAIIDEPKIIGGFLLKHQGRFLGIDNVKITPINNGSGGKKYKIQRFTVDTVDGNEGSTVDETEKWLNGADSEIPFLIKTPYR